MGKKDYLKKKRKEKKKEGRVSPLKCCGTPFLQWPLLDIVWEKSSNPHQVHRGWVCHCLLGQGGEWGECSWWKSHGHCDTERGKGEPGLQPLWQECNLWWCRCTGIGLWLTGRWPDHLKKITRHKDKKYYVNGIHLDVAPEYSWAGELGNQMHDIYHRFRTLEKMFSWNRSMREISTLFWGQKRLWEGNRGINSRLQKGMKEFLCLL